MTEAAATAETKAPRVWLPSEKMASWWRPTATEERKHKILAVLGIVALTIVGASERVIFKIVVDLLSPYGYFLALVFTGCYVPICFAMVLRKTYRKEGISDEISQFPKQKFLLMAVLDLGQMMIMLINGPTTSGFLSVILLQAVVPLTMLVSMFVRNLRYDKLHYIGSVFITSGVFLGLFPTLAGFVSKSTSERQTSWSSVFYLLSTVLGSISTLYKEQSIRSKPMDIFYLNAWVSLFEFLVALLCAPAFMAFYGMRAGQRLDAIPCLIHGDLRNGAYCRLGFLFVLVYVAVNVLMGFIMIQLVKRSSNINFTYVGITLSFVVAAVVLEIYDLVFSSVAVGSLFFNFFSFIAVTVGLAVYRLKREPDVEVLTLSELETVGLVESQEDGNGPARYG